MEQIIKRYFEFVGSDGKTAIDHSKFWEVWVDGLTLRTRYGKIGANGQTTVKSFTTESDADVAQVKAIAEKTKKGYVEKTEVAETSNVLAGGVDADDSEVTAAKAVFQRWVAKYTPVSYINFVLEDLPIGISEECIWSEVYSDDWNYLIKGFSDSSQVLGYYLTTVPVDDKTAWEEVATELTRYCETCEGVGEIDDELCAACDGAGTFYIETDEFELPIISNQKELDAFLRKSATSGIAADGKNSAPTVNFCSECGTRRGSPTAKFCGECGTSF
jgi:predicted DNA-binding WGR domain protein